MENLMETTAEQAREQGDSEVQITGAQYKSKMQLSITDALYGLIVAAAALIRFSGLNLLPLSPSEAQGALSAWQFMRGGQDMAINSPAYMTLTSLVMPFLGASDVTARLIPALFGLGLVILPWLLREKIGALGVLATAALFTVSPLFSITSRTAGGEGIALFAILLLFIAANRFGGQDNRGWLYTAGAALGLGFSSSPLFYSGLFTLLLAWLTWRLVNPEEKPFQRPQRQTFIQAAILTLLVATALSTRFFTYLSGIGAAANLLGDWLAQFSLQGDLQALISPFLVVARYEVVLLPLGILAIIWAVWRNHLLGTLCTYWLLTGMILILLQRGILDNALLLPLAGYILLGLVSDQLLQRNRNRWTWAVVGLVILIGSIVLVNVARFLRVSLVEAQVANLWVALMAFAMGSLFIYYFWSEHRKQIVQGIWLGIMILLLLFQWGTAWNLTHISANDPRESWVEQATDDDVGQLSLALYDISRRADNSDRGIPIFSAVDSPVLRWYLRDFPQAQFGHALPLGAQHEVIISPAVDSEPILGDDYLGGDFGLLRTQTEETTLSMTPLLDTLRWSLFHESARSIREDRIILWIRSDITQD